MRVLFDTDVLIDVLLDREPHAEGAADLLSRVERGEIQGFACANSFTTIFYLARKAAGLDQARSHISLLLSILEVAPVNRAVLEEAKRSSVRDFEDAVVVASAGQVEANCIVTRNARDFAKSSVPAHSPASLAAMLDTLRTNRD